VAVKAPTPSPSKVDLTKRRYRNFLEELLRCFEAEERDKTRQLEEKRAALKQARQNFAYETFRDTLKRNLTYLKGSQDQKSFETIVKSFCSLESDINKAAICDYIYTILMVSNGTRYLLYGRYRYLPSYLPF
jgi:hypothetical protein